MQPKKANHQANIVRINDVFVHPNADTLELINVNGYQVVSKKGQFKVGDLAVYIQPDRIVPQTEPVRFIWQPYLDDIQNNPVYCKHFDENEASTVLMVRLENGDTEYVCTRCHLHDPYNPKVPEKKRRITVRKFRKEWSEGLLLPLSDFPDFTFISIEQAAEYYYNPESYWVYTNTMHQYEAPIKVRETADVSDLLGITHYDPDAGKETGEESNAPKLKKKYPRSLRGWYNFLVRKFKNFLRLGDDLGGSNDNISLGIPVYDVDALKNYPHTFEDGEPVIVTEKIHGSNARFLFLDGVMYAGSRKLWKSPNSTCIFRRALKELPWIEEWCREHEGYVLWGEITPTQGGFEYGSKNVQFFVFDVRTPDGKWLDREHDEAGLLAQLMAYSVPVLYQGPYDLAKIKTFVDGPSTIKGAKNIREGVVIKTAVEKHITGTGRAQMKVVSNAYLEKETK